ncbi:hypothetical protein J2X83_003450 [Brevibacillus nitrificans]|nr:hypothetical protein [Brevibacillus nitrificans]
MILEPGDLPVFVYTLISFGSKEEVRIVACCHPRFVFLFSHEGEQSVFLFDFQEDFP